MGPDGMSSPVCLQKEACVPIGGQSVWARTQQSSLPITLLAVAMDGLGEFYEEFRDPRGAGVSIAVLLAVADSLSKIAETATHEQLMIAFFQGESWGRVGSRKFLHDLQFFSCAQEVKKEDSPFNDRICSSPLKVGLLGRSVVAFARILQAAS